MGQKQTLEAREANKKAVAKYLELRPSKLEARGGLPDEPLSRKSRGSTRPPVNAAGTRWIEDAVTFHERSENSEASEELPDPYKYISTLNAIIEAYGGGKEKHKGVPYSAVVGELWNNPTAVADWHEYGDSESKAYKAAFNSLCYRIAAEFGQIYPGVEMKVCANPKDEKLDRSQWQVAHNRDNNEKRTIRKENSYRLITMRLETLMAENNVGPERAIEILQSRVEISRARCYRALSFVRDETWNSA